VCSYLSVTPKRARIDLAGPWAYVLENGEAGTVYVPSVFDFVGAVEYQRMFTIRAEDLDLYQFQLVVYGANYSCDVTINGEFLGNHQGGYTSFTMPIPADYLQASQENTIKLLVHNRLDARSTLPLRPLTWGFRNYGGLHRDIYILATPKVCIKDVAVESILPPEGTGPARLVITPQIEGKNPAIPAGTNLGFGFEMVDAVSGISAGRSAIVPVQAVGETWAAGRPDLTIASPRLWSPDVPDRYMVKCQLFQMNGKEAVVIDEYQVSYGIRSIVLRGGDILLNGKRLVVRAVAWYEDHPDWGPAIPYEEREKDVIQIKHLGANTIRFIGHAPDPTMLDLCDTYGLMAMEDLPLADCPAEVLTIEAYQEFTAGMLKEMVVRDRNHPSVLAWGIGDEVQCFPHRGAAFLKHLVDTLQTLDGRPAYRGVRLGYPDSCVGLTPMEICNVYVQDLKQARKAVDEWRSERKGIVVMARVGAEVNQANTKGFNDPLSQQAQARFMLQRLEMIRTLDFDGVVIWSYNDWRGDRPALTVHTDDPWKHSMGLVSERRDRRLSFDAVRSVFRGEKPSALSAGTYSPRAPIIYVVIGFIVLILTVYLYNANKRFREHVNRSVMNSYNFFADVRDQFAVSVIHTTLLALVVSVATAIVASSVLLHFRDSLFLDNLLSYLLVSDDLKAMTVRLIWDPLRFIGVITLVIFVGLVLLSGVVHQLRLFMKARVFAFHAYTATIWSTTPLLAFIPIGMILYRAMDGTVYVASALIIIVLFFVWVLLRLLRAVSIVYDVYPPKVYVFGLLILGVLGGIGYLYFDLVQSAPMYLTFLYTMVGAGR
jgi:hypothetical protein